MARWVSGSGKWMDCHCVLTRCGFLHWSAGSPPDPADIVPADSLNLSRSANLVQLGNIMATELGCGALFPHHDKCPPICIKNRCGERALHLTGLLCNCRCQFENGEAQAQEFNLIEVAAGVFGRSRRLIFKASSMEECCEWAIVLREAIAEHTRK